MIEVHCEYYAWKEKAEEQSWGWLHYKLLSKMGLNVCY